MKKVTLIYFLLINFIGFSQSITWNNPVTSAAPGQTLSMDISYDANPEDLFYVLFEIREVDDTFAIVNSYNTTFPVNETNGPEPNQQSNITFDYELDASIPASSTLPPGNQYLIIVAMSLNNDAIFRNDNRSINIDPTLSTGDFGTKENFSAFYPNPVKDVLYFTDNVKSQEYRILDLSGRVVKSENASTTLNVAELNAGTYFIETENGIGKFLKY
ncbi:T9SS type A sorting domain-containing protein [Aquimarina sp. ERC-38]|uniref:T9SS type A sorting domain-containing protein n=1 Tax=Aquimarina sp. ERC-38 TaxID=2949996 RepID=UPI002246BAD6|nr:T9SS type A sorting domain-containing protein [Aquimarina sp. ERC-38]UZO82600.1 T9SS type A sorting domain-containing protein [Aquimarina sp. ERC-38]